MTLADHPNQTHELSNDTEMSFDYDKAQAASYPMFEPTPSMWNVTVQSLAWKDLGVAVRDRKGAATKAILENVSGVARPGMRTAVSTDLAPFSSPSLRLQGPPLRRQEQADPPLGEMMALMGPSGSGKTTLLNTLAQRQAQKVSGKVLVNGEEQPASVHRSISAYVEQEDTLIGSITTQETLQFSAHLAISKSNTKHGLEARVRTLIDEFGLQNHTDTLIGTPFRKGLSGGQKRRVSVAAQLITNPSVLFLDEPTSGLDSTASYEIMSYIKHVARQHNLIVVASIHQPSTKTFDLFDQVTLLSQGRVCFTGCRTDLPDYFAELGYEIPTMMNPAEHILDLVNTDFSNDPNSRERLEMITNGWQNSILHHGLAASIDEHIRTRAHSQLPSPCAVAARPHVMHQTFILLRRSWIKSYRDIVTYWVRVAMYLGLAIMMGTVWLRLPTSQEYIQNFINAIFFGSAFMSFMAVAYVPAFLEDRALFVKERANGLYGPTAFMLSNFLIGIPYLFLITALFSVVAYWLGNFNPTATHFFRWVMWLFLDLLAAESLVVLIASMIPNFVAALAITAFANGLWMCVGGFLVSLPTLNVFWKYAFHYWDYQAYVFQGMMVNEFSTRTYACSRGASSADCHCMYQSTLQNQCQIAGSAVLNQYGYSTGHEGLWAGILLAIIAGYRIAALILTWLRKT